MDIFLLYLLMQADSICGTFTFLIVFSSISSVILAIAGAMKADVDDDEFSPKIKLYLKVCLVVGVTSLCIGTVFPSTKTIAVMFGGHYALEAAKSETGQKVQKLVNDTLDKAIENINAK